MSGNGELRKMLQEKRLQHQLEIQSRQIESVLSQNEVDAQVEGGYVQPRSIRFDITSQLEAGLGKLRFLKHDILNVLGVADVEIGQSNGRWHLNIIRPEEPPVSFLDMLSFVPDVEPLTAVIGMSEEGAPILIELSENAIPHMLITGDEKAGKTSLLRTIALSLAVTNKQHQLQLAVLDNSKKVLFGRDKILGPLSYLPHMVCAVAQEIDDQKDLLEFLLSELAYRQEQSMSAPGIVVLVDEVVALMHTMGPFAEEAIATLLQWGASVGIHLVLTTENPESRLISQTMRLNLPLWLIGKTTSGENKPLNTRMNSINPAYLLGQGDFLAELDEELTHFQAAFIGDYDLHLTLETLHRNRPTPLMAHSFFVTNSFVPDDNNDVSIITFNKNDKGFQLQEYSDGAEPPQAE